MNASRLIPESVAAWYASLARREQKLVLVGSAVIVLLVAYLGVIQPIVSARARLLHQVQQRRQLLAYINSAAPRLRAAGSPTNRSGLNSGHSVFTTVSAAAQNSPISGAVQRLEQTSDGDVQLSVSGASFDALIRWLGTLAAKDGISVTQANVQRAANPGTVNGNFTLSGS